MAQASRLCASPTYRSQAGRLRHPYAALFPRELRFVLSPLFSTSEFPLGLTNPLYVAVEMIETYDPHPDVPWRTDTHVARVSLAGSIAFFTISTALFVALGKGPLGKRARPS